MSEKRRKRHSPEQIVRRSAPSVAFSIRFPFRKNRIVFFRQTFIARSPFTGKGTMQSAKKRFPVARRLHGIPCNRNEKRLS